MHYRTIRRCHFLCAFIAGILLLLALTGTKAYAAHTFYLDAVNGNDATDDGSSSKPYKTTVKAMSVVSSGDTILLNSGNYGTFMAGRTDPIDYAGNAVNLFTDWVSFKAAPAQTPHLNKIDLGTLMYLDSASNRHKLDIGNGQPAGNANAYLRFEGLTIDDGVSIEGSR